MTIDVAMEHEIRRLFVVEKWKRGTIASQLGIHSDVVERVLGASDVVARPVRARRIDPFVGFIDETLTVYPRLRSTRLYHMLVERGYEGSTRTLRNYVAGVRPSPKSEAYLRCERLIGEQSQIDWGHVGYVDVPGGRRPLWVFVFLLAYSRARFAELVLDMTVESLRRSLLRAAEYFGGVTRQWLFDNPKTVVLGRRGDAVRFHPELLDLAGTLRVQPRLCRVRKPTDKGGVERAVRDLKEGFFAGRTIQTVEGGNRELERYLRQVVLKRSHPRVADRTVEDVLSEEKPHLLSLPENLPSQELVMPVSVDRTASIRLSTNLYSVPPEYAGKTLTLVANEVELRLLDRGCEIARHPRCWGKKQHIEDPAHRRALVEQRRASWIPKGRDRLKVHVPQIDALYAQWVECGRNVGSMTARTLKLLDLYGGDIIQWAVREMLARGTHDPGALALLCEEARRNQNRPIPALLELQAHVPDADVIPHDLGFYDKNEEGQSHD
jgi:transposase